MTTYPDLNRLPSVLETAEVESVLQQILSTLPKDPSPDVVSIAELMVDAFHARGYRTDEEYDVNLCSRILRWVRRNWSSYGNAFANVAIAHEIGSPIEQNTTGEPCRGVRAPGRQGW